MSTTLFPYPMVPLNKIEPAIALTPLDGRYKESASALVNYMSEPALNRARLLVEVRWLEFLCDRQVVPGLEPLTCKQRDYLESIVRDFDAEQIAALGEIERVTRHDVKAVEYHIQRALDAAVADEELAALSKLGAGVHIFCTSEDINNLAWALCLHEAVAQVWLPKARELQGQLELMAKAASEMPMLARTHGQPATPVTMGKELAVFAHRLGRQLGRVERTEYLGKFNGATGTWACHSVALPDVDWPAMAREFVESLGLTFNPLTTQIESHDWQADLYADLIHACRIMHNLATDVWTYISLGYFKQVLSAQGSTGSSTMPHKVNPIRFENAEANLEVACALFDVLAATLVTSRLQRDLTDSSMQRNIGPALGHSLLAINNLLSGLRGLDYNPEAMAGELDCNWETLGEAIQQVMRVEALGGKTGMDNPYERLKELTRGRKVDSEALEQFVRGLGLEAEHEARLLALSPRTYTGYSSKLATGEF